ncbi:MAG: hypothetical protein HKN36_09435 [Hellea sp.]|nr:hypothetical protein [Hellea sp.]
MSGLDIGVIAALIAILILIGLTGRKGAQTTEGFFLGSEIFTGTKSAFRDLRLIFPLRP